LYAHWITVNYREAYGIFACSGILFNHESPIRGETFVTRKLARAAVRIAAGLEQAVYVGNLDARRDWGHARDYVQAMWLMLQQPVPDDYVIATGETHSVREFCERAFSRAGISLEWRGNGVQEVGVSRASDHAVVRVDPRYFRPTEVESLVGDASKAREKLGWSPQIRFAELVDMMVEAERVALESGKRAVAD
jgi:GDPmannose 4,6-dehydratase